METMHENIILALILFFQVLLFVGLVVLVGMMNNNKYLYIIRKEWAFIFMGWKLLFRRAIPIRIHPAHSSIHQWTDEYYLLKIIKCSDQRYFKVISGDFITIIPESAIQQIDGIEPAKYQP